MDNIKLAKSLLEWNKCYLTYNSNIKKENIADCFAGNFIVRANGKNYNANHDNYLEFLNNFRATIKSIDYTVYEYIIDNDSIVLPMIAKIVRIDDTIDNFDAMLWLKFNTVGLITLWHEVYIKI